MSENESIQARNLRDLAKGLRAANLMGPANMCDLIAEHIETQWEHISKVEAENVRLQKQVHELNFRLSRAKANG